MGKRLIRKAVAAAVIIFVLYLAVGAIAPFVNYREISPDTAAGVETGSFRSEETGPDRALVLETGISAWEQRIRLMSQAQDRILLSTFDMRDGESTRDLLAVMMHKADEGVKVQILVDGYSGLLRLEPNPLFYAVSAHPNMEIRIYNPVNIFQPWKTQGRMHDKYVIVDDTAFILGGRNTFDYFIGDYDSDHKSLDREVLVYNTLHGTEDSAQSSLGQVEDYFNDIWNMDVCRPFHEEEAYGEKRRVQKETALLKERYEWLTKEYPSLFDNSYDYAANTCETNRISLVSGPTGLYGKEPVVFHTLTELMKEAREKVVIHTPYIVMNDYMQETLRQVAETVPDTRLVINSVENGDNFVASSDYKYHEKDILNTGMALYQYDGGISTHGKSVVIDDDLSVIGSYNFDLRSTYVDTELMLVIHSTDLTAQLTGYFEDIEKDCRYVTAEGEHIIPEHITVAEAALWKRAAWKVVGLILQPFRCLV